MEDPIPNIEKQMKEAEMEKRAKRKAATQSKENHRNSLKPKPKANAKPPRGGWGLEPSGACGGLLNRPIAQAIHPRDFYFPRR